MAGDIPGQILPVVDGKRLADPIWYEWFSYLRRFVRNAEGSWTPFTPVVTGSTVAGPVVITNNGCRYRRTGHTIDITYDFTMTNLNGATGFPLASLPVSPSIGLNVLVGREIALTGFTLMGQLFAGGTVCQFSKYDNTSALIVNWRLSATGVYEV